MAINSGQPVCASAPSRSPRLCGAGRPDVVGKRRVEVDLVGGCRVSGQLSERVLVDQQLVEPAFEVTRLGL
jgi:hypothetical protein